MKEVKMNISNYIKLFDKLKKIKFHFHESLLSSSNNFHEWLETLQFEDYNTRVKLNFRRCNTNAKVIGISK